ncbi:MAG: hypothetical protein IPN77_04775 [Sandaracinaceae bacterium]|nr:hypothetical protein [Sandaracinaceae bacterium]
MSGVPGGHHLALLDHDLDDLAALTRADLHLHIGLYGPCGAGVLHQLAARDAHGDARATRVGVGRKKK